jgi:hypothetical protein
VYAVFSFCDEPHSLTLGDDLLIFVEEDALP